MTSTATLSLPTLIVPLAPVREKTQGFAFPVEVRSQLLFQLGGQLFDVGADLIVRKTMWANYPDRWHTCALRVVGERRQPHVGFS